MRNGHGHFEQQADAIHAAVEELHDRLNAYTLGADRQFNPMDEVNNQAFRNLWAATFNLKLPPQEQDALLAELEKKYPGTLDKMREVGNISEIEMEKGHAKHMIEQAKDLIPDVMPWYTPERAARIVNALARYREKAKTRDLEAMWTPMEGDPHGLSPGLVRLSTATKVPNYLLEDFPHRTYWELHSGEKELLYALKGLKEGIYEPNMVHLIVEAGATPQTAIFDSIHRNACSHGNPGSGQVICTISDAESAALAQQLITELERLNVLQKDDIRIIHVDPHSDAFKSLKFCDKHGNPVTPYAATITQLVKGRKNVEAIAYTLAEQHGINTFVVRGAHQMTRLLYEPMDHLNMPGGMHCRLTAVPPYAEISAADEKENDIAVKHHGECYNTSHVYSSRETEPGAMLKHPIEFRDSPAKRKKRGMSISNVQLTIYN